MSVRSILIICAAYMLACGLLLLPSLRLEVFPPEASEIRQASIHLAQTGIFSLDGEHPTHAFEPGMSFLLAVLHKTFGSENRIALFGFQIIFHFIASLAFVSSVSGSISAAVQTRLLLFLLLMPSILHGLFSGSTESVMLSLLLLSAALFERWRDEQAWSFALALGIVWGLVLMTDASFWLFPVLVALLGLLRRFPVKQLVPVVAIPLLLVGAWSLRNERQVERFEPRSGWKATATLFARAERAEFVQGWEPFQCLHAEFVLQNRESQQAACFTDEVIDAAWPGHHPSSRDEAIRAESLQRLRNHWPNYLWTSVFEAVEFHLPTGTERGIVFDFSSAMVLTTVYAGCFLAFFAGWRVPYDYCLLLGLYTLLVCAAFDATPRYHMPVIFCYVLPACVGLSSLVDRFQKWLI